MDEVEEKIMGHIRFIRSHAGCGEALDNLLELFGVYVNLVPDSTTRSDKLNFHYTGTMRCHRGHEHPAGLWNCPECTDEPLDLFRKMEEKILKEFTARFPTYAYVDPLQALGIYLGGGERLDEMAVATLNLIASDYENGSQSGINPDYIRNLTRKLGGESREVDGYYRLRAIAFNRFLSLAAQVYGEDGFPGAPPFVARALGYAVDISCGLVEWHPPDNPNANTPAEQDIVDSAQPTQSREALENEKNEVICPHCMESFVVLTPTPASRDSEAIVEAVATYLETPYPESHFGPVSDEEYESVDGSLRTRMHAAWARHWANVIRDKKDAILKGAE